MTDGNRYNWLLVASPLLGWQTWDQVASEMRRTHGCEVTVPRIEVSAVGESDHLGFWAGQIIEQVTSHRPAMVVAHGAAAPRVCWLAGQLLAAGLLVAGVVAVDGRFPEGGKAPTQARPSFGSLVDGVARPDDYLPPWPRWWGTLADELVPARLRQDVLADAPMVPREVFDQVIPDVTLPDSLHYHYLGFGDGYCDELDRAAMAGWRTTRLPGQHLHQLVAPAAVARALVETSTQPAT